MAILHVEFKFLIKIKKFYHGKKLVGGGYLFWFFWFFLFFFNNFFKWLPDVKLKFWEHFSVLLLHKEFYQLIKIKVWDHHFLIFQKSGIFSIFFWFIFSKIFLKGLQMSKKIFKTTFLCQFFMENSNFLSKFKNSFMGKS